MAILNLVKKDESAPSYVKEDGKQLKIVDVLQEARLNHNELVDAINSLNVTLNEISAKLDGAKLGDHPNADLKASIEFNESAIIDIKTKVVPALEAQLSANLNKVKADLTVTIDKNTESIVSQEGHSRRKNIIINGQKEDKDEVAEEVVREFFVSDMKIDRETVDQYIFRDVHRLPKSKKAKPEAPRPLIVAFVRQKDRNEVMRNAYQLKNSDHSIKSDLPKALNELRGKMLGERKRLQAANRGTKYRVAEKSYRPVLQRSNGVVEGTTKIKWADIAFTG